MGQEQQGTHGGQGCSHPCVFGCCRYRVRWRGEPGPFFRFEDGSSLRKLRFVERIRRALASRGSTPGPFFRFDDGSSLTKQICGADSKGFSVGGNRSEGLLRAQL